MQLRQQFLWSAQQAIEKYLKAILLFNGLSARYVTGNNGEQFGHNLIALLAKVKTVPIFVLDLNTEHEDFINYLFQQGDNRYIGKSAYNLRDALNILDGTVWHIRRHCQYMTKCPFLGLQADSVKTALDPGKKPQPQHFKLFPGESDELNKVVKRSSTDQARRALIWGNLYYGVNRRAEVTYNTFSSTEISPYERDWLGVDWKLITEYVKP